MFYSLSRKTVNTRENFWNVYCFATNQILDETAKDNRQTAEWLITTWHETTSSLLLPRRIFNWLFSNAEFLTLFSALLSPKNRYERHFTKSEVNQEDRSKKKWTNQKRCFSVFVSRAVQKVMLVGCDWWFSIRTFL